MILNCQYHVYGIIVSDIGLSLKIDALGYILLQKVYVYFQPLLRKAPWNLPSSVK